ncbi:MAG: class II aldolase/adducin family protein, partial [Acidobacteriota bacterium]|nr:class II aldolase/adducin family protein [Acidobacteriota bacterium]
MDKTKEQIIKIGRAMLALGLQNTHSGNISIRMGEDMYITKTGSMKGHLEERDIVISGLKEPKFGLFQASSEIGTHQKIL